MQTLTYGFLLPQTGDKGASLWSALEGNISQLNSHSHNGVDSSLIPASSIQGTQSAIQASGWASYSGPIGHYRQLVTMPTGYLFDSVCISFRTSTGVYVYPSVERNANTSYYVYTTDPTLQLVAYYGL